MSSSRNRRVPRSGFEHRLRSLRLVLACLAGLLLAANAATAAAKPCWRLAIATSAGPTAAAGSHPSAEIVPVDESGGKPVPAPRTDSVSRCPTLCLPAVASIAPPIAPSSVAAAVGMDDEATSFMADVAVPPPR